MQTDEIDWLVQDKISILDALILDKDIEKRLTTPLARQRMTHYRGRLQDAIKALKSLSEIENNYTQFHVELYGEVHADTN